ncbi:unnamed protein product [Pleuronectes platessa]|uniref:Uncharacterized protein n=1 Tax=Pleuronectes platessa TaxID=8262 RepID=A0A9N7YHL0_PLEPL|nr:unnamed protein product [Pleuronectes platessa]
MLALVPPDTYFQQAVTSTACDGAPRQPVHPPDNPRAWMVGVQLSFIILGLDIPFPFITIFYLLVATAIALTSNQEHCISRRLIFTHHVVFLACLLSLLTVLPPGEFPEHVCLWSTAASTLSSRNS